MSGCRGRALVVSPLGMQQHCVQEPMPERRRRRTILATELLRLVTLLSQLQLRQQQRPLKLRWRMQRWQKLQGLQQYLSRQRQQLLLSRQRRRQFLRGLKHHEVVAVEVEASGKAVPAGAALEESSGKRHYGYDPEFSAQEPADGEIGEATYSNLEEKEEETGHQFNSQLGLGGIGKGALINENLNSHVTPQDQSPSSSGRELDVSLVIHHRTMLRANITPNETRVRIKYEDSTGIAACTSTSTA